MSSNVEHARPSIYFPTLRNPALYAAIHPCLKPSRKRLPSPAISIIDIGNGLTADEVRDRRFRDSHLSPQDWNSSFDLPHRHIRRQRDNSATGKHGLTLACVDVEMKVVGSTSDVPAIFPVNKHLEIRIRPIHLKPLKIRLIPHGPNS